MIITTRSAGRLLALILLFTVLQVSFFSQVELLGTSMWILPACAAIRCRAVLPARRIPRPADG